MLIFLLCLWWPNSNFLCCGITQSGESSRDLLLSVTNRKAFPRHPPPTHNKTFITLLPVTFSQLDPQLGVGWGKMLVLLIGYLLTDGLNCLTVKYLAGWHLVGWLCWGLTSQSIIFQSCRDGAIASWVINQYFRGVKCQGHNTAEVGLEPRTSRSGVRHFRGVKCLAQGHNTAEVGLEPRTSRSGVRHSTTEPPRSPGWHLE